MTIKKATLIALCGNAVVLLISPLAWLGLFPYRFLGLPTNLIIDVLGTGTLVFFLLTLYRKQP
jgi:ABC-type enterochelin transport system permease subunit